MDYLQEAQLAEESSGTKTHKLLFFIFFGIIFFVIILGVFSIFNGGNKNISSNKLIEGVALEVGENDVIKFDLEEEEHGMIINFVGDGSVELTISSEPINLSLKINEIKEIDLNNDGVFDLKIKLVSIVDGTATIAFQKIEKESCKEDWECSEWSTCYKVAQKRKCEDLNSCGTIFDRPIIIKGCLEIEFVEDDSAFDEELHNQSINNSLNNTHPTNFTNTTNVTNLTNNNFTNLTSNTTNTSLIIHNTTNVTNPTNNNFTNLTINPTNISEETYNISNTTNITTKNNTLNTTNNTLVCASGTLPCYESQGFFCAGINHYASDSVNPLCCSGGCLKFNSKDQLCYARGYLYFTGNNTHICKVQVYSPFNGTNILCCASIELRKDTTLTYSNIYSNQT